MKIKQDRNGVAFYWEYDGESIGAKCTHTWGPEGIFEYWFEYEQGCTNVKNGHGNVTSYYYDNQGLIIKEVDARGFAYTTEYNEFQEVISETNPLDESTYYGYDEFGNQTSILSPGGESMEIVFEDDRPVMAKNATNALWIWEYNKQGELKTRIGPDNDVTHYAFEKGLLVSVTDANGEDTRFVYDKHYNVVEMLMPGERKTEWGYNFKGLCTSVLDTDGNRVSYSYDELNRIVRLEQPDGNRTLLEYDAYDDVLFAKDAHHKIQFEYTPLGSIKSRTENNTRVEFQYNKEDQLVSIINENGSTYWFKRDGAGLIVQETGFDGLTREYIHDGAGKIEKVKLPDGRETKYHYDRGGRVVRILHSNGQEELFSYDQNGSLAEAINENSRVAFERNPIGRVLKEIQGFAEVSSEYNYMGQRVKITSNLGADIAIEHNFLGNITKTKASQGDAAWQAEMQYNSLGLEIERLLPGGIKNSWQYTKDGRPLEHTVGNSKSTYRSKRYQWDVNNRLKSITDLLTQTTIQFSHDLFGNLASAQYADGSWDYRLPDAVGNLFRTKEKTDRKYGPAGQLLESPKYKYTYDQLGNLASKISKKDGSTWQYLWGDTGMLEKVIRPDSGEVTFKYDALGRRVEKTFNGFTTKWVWDGNVPLHEWHIPAESSDMLINASGEAEIKPPENLISWIFNEETFIPAAKLVNKESQSIVTDHLGTPCHMFDKTGQKTWEAELDIYGKVRKLASGSLSDCPFRYQGQYEDVETGLYYNRYRYYDPEDGVYVSQDPIGMSGGAALYGYVKDTTTYLDTFGLIAAPSTVPNTSGVYTLTNPTLNEAYVGSGVDANTRMSNTSHTKAQKLLNHPDTKVEFTSVDLGTATTRKDQNRILRHYEQQEFEATKNTGKYTMLNSNNPEAIGKRTRNKGIASQHGASKGTKITCCK
jgi:RHS repeat-associated protein